MINREKVIRHIIAEIGIAKTCKKDFASVDIDMLSDALDLLKEQDELLHKKQKDIDRLCNEISEWKHKFHDILPEEREAEAKWIYGEEK